MTVNEEMILALKIRYGLDQPLMLLNPIISSIGGLLPTIVSGATLTSIVLSLPTIGPLLLAQVAHFLT